MSRAPKGAIAIAAAITCVTGALPLTTAVASGAKAYDAPQSGGKTADQPAVSTGNIDIRVGGGGATAERNRAAASAQLSAAPAVRALADRLGPQSLVDIDPLTGTPRQVARLDGLLTGSSAAPAKDIALGFVRDNAAAFGLSAKDIDGLVLVRDYVDIAGTHHLSFSQRAGGVTLFGNGLKANVTKKGELINVTGAPVSGLTAPTAAPKLSKAEALATAKKAVGEKDVSQGSRDYVEDVLFHTAGGTRRAIQTITMSGSKPALSVIDAESGRVLYRKDLRSHLSSESAGPRYGQVYENYPAAPGTGGTAKVVNLRQNRWLSSETTLSGNNVHTYTDVDDDDTADTGEEIRPTGTRGYIFPLKRVGLPAPYPCKTYVCTWNPDVRASWKQNMNRASVQNFYFINVWHDYLQQAPIGFTEAAGNFQVRNTTGQGEGGDAVINHSLDGAATDNGMPDYGHVDNANFATPPDGISPTMQMFLFHAPGLTWEEDPSTPAMGADAADIVYHEYGHGLSNRLVVDANGVSALDAQQSGGMGEAWSDWYGLDYLVNKGHLINTPKPGEVVEGTYVTAGPGIRTEPIDCPVGATSSVCPGIPGTLKGGYTYGDFGTIFSYGGVHAAGEIWAQTLWDLRAAIGSTRARSLVTRAMELSPTNPSYLDMRNSIIQADVALYNSADVAKVWTVFAKRGMGFFAATTGGNDRKPVENFSTPPQTTQRATMTGTITTAGSSNEPVANAVISISGHTSGLPGDYTTTTNAQGEYTMPGLYPGHYPQVVITAPGYDSMTVDVNLGRGVQVRNFTLVRNWAATSGGAVVTEFSGNDDTNIFCGPPQLLDQSQTTGWSSQYRGEPLWMIIKLPATVNISTFLIDPAPTCGDSYSSMTALGILETSPDGTTWTKSLEQEFSQGYAGKLTAFAPAPGSGQNVRYVRFTKVWPLSPSSRYVDATELEVLGVRSN